MNAAESTFDAGAGSQRFLSVRSSDALSVNRVLIADDDVDIHRLLQARLAKRGFDVATAFSGEEALALLDVVRPDLIFLDVSMERLSGFDVLDEIRRRGVDVAVILTTAFGSEQVAIDALRHGADDYLRKPFDRVDFQSVLDRTIARLMLSRQNAQLRLQLEEKQLQLTAELARAAEVQADLLPVELPEISGFDLAGRCLPARVVGGDFYDCQRLSDGTVNLTVGDVMGKGMSAAILMATVRAAVRAMARRTPADVVQHAAHALDCDLERAGAFVTLVHAQLDVRTAELRCVDAGHGHLFLRRASGEVEALNSENLPLGVSSDEVFREYSTILSPGDTLVIYSDGLVEARPELFSTREAIARLITPNTPASETANRLADLALENGPLTDDLTVVVLCRNWES
jgi:sigma-B regulation protein RsbU (phosphoserine phosphatase)